MKYNVNEAKYIKGRTHKCTESNHQRQEVVAKLNNNPEFVIVGISCDECGIFEKPKPIEKSLNKKLDLF